MATELLTFLLGIFIGVAAGAGLIMYMAVTYQKKKKDDEYDD